MAAAEVTCRIANYELLLHNLAGTMPISRGTVLIFAEQKWDCPFRSDFGHGDAF